MASAIVQTEMQPPPKKAKLDNILLKRQNDISAYYLDDKFADVVFVFKTEDDEQQCVHAHRIILAAKSPAFQVLLYGFHREEMHIAIDDTDRTSSEFAEFLQFFYLENVELTIENIHGVMYFIDKYQITECFDVCDTFLIQQEDIVLSMEEAVTHNRFELVIICLRKMNKLLCNMFATKSFFKCEKDILKDILESGELKCSPVHTFNSCVKWAELKCVKSKLDPALVNCRQQLRDVFHLIPFEKMAGEDIKQCVWKYSELFERCDLIDLFRLMPNGASLVPAL